MAWLAGTTAHRLGMVLSLVLLLSLALPEMASGKHRRPLLRSSLAAFATDTPPDSFKCSWVEAEASHDYECWPLPGNGPATYRLTGPIEGEPPKEPPLTTLLSPSAEYPHDNIAGWGGPFPLAHPDIADTFECTKNVTRPPSENPASQYDCKFIYNGHTHEFTADEIVSVIYRESFFFTEQWFVPCDLPPAPCVPVEPPVPDTIITGGPFGTVRSTGANFVFSSSRAGSIFQCRLEGRSWQSCSSPRRYSDLSDGGHLFEVRAGDVAGNFDATPAARRWRVDTLGPRMGIPRRTVRLSRRGVAKLGIRCLAEEQGGPCTGRLTLKTVQRVRASQLGRVTLGRKSFTIPTGVRAAVSVKLSRRHRRLVVRLGRLRIRAAVRALDRLRNVAETSQVFYLRAPGD